MSRLRTHNRRRLRALRRTERGRQEMFWVVHDEYLEQLWINVAEQFGKSPQLDFYVVGAAAAHLFPATQAAKSPNPFALNEGVNHEPE